MEDHDLSMFLRLGQHLLKSGKRQQAQKVFLRCIDRFPDDFRAYFNMGTLHSIGRDYDNAIYFYRMALSVKSDLVEAFGALSGLLIQVKDPGAAADCCLKGLEIDSCDRQCIYNLNVSLRQLGQLYRAVSTSWERINHSAPTMTAAFDSGTVTTTATTLSRRPIAMCVKYGSKYSAQYVNNLYNGITKYSFTGSRRRKSNETLSTDGRCCSRNVHNDDDDVAAFTDVDRSIRFICITEDPKGIDECVEILPFPDEVLSAHWDGWWLKAYVFRVARDLLGDSDSDMSRVTTAEKPSKRTTCSDEASTSMHYHPSSSLRIKGGGDDDQKGEDLVEVEQQVAEGRRIRDDDNQNIGGPFLVDRRPWICYFDLDTVISGPIDFLFQPTIATATVATTTVAGATTMEPGAVTQTTYAAQPGQAAQTPQTAQALLANAPPLSPQIESTKKETTHKKPINVPVEGLLTPVSAYVQRQDHDTGDAAAESITRRKEAPVCPFYTLGAAYLVNEGKYLFCVARTISSNRHSNMISYLLPKTPP
jgi:hypothetical protein